MRRTVAEQPGRSPRGLRELLLVAALYLAYAGSRLASLTPTNAATDNARQLLDIERALHFAPEHTLNDLLYAAPTWVAVASAYFYQTMHYAMTVLTLVWLYRLGPNVYERARNWLVAMTFPALVVFWLFPVAPPRSVPGAVGHDVVAEQHRYGWWGAGGGTAPRGLSALVNENAALPSLHVGWALWVGWHLFHHTRNRVVRAFGIAYPTLTVAVVLATGNHYVLDVAAGVLLAVMSKLRIDGVARRIRLRRLAMSPTASSEVALALRQLDRSGAPARRRCPPTRRTRRRIASGPGRAS